MSLDPSLCALSMLHKIGPTSRVELVSLIEGLSLTLINKLESAGHIKRHLGDTDVVSITTAGRKRAGIVDPRIAPARKQIATGDEDNYNGLELRPFTGRKGANDAFALPSRGYRC
jgi:hypothetical protein